MNIIRGAGDTLARMDFSLSGTWYCIAKNLNDVDFQLVGVPVLSLTGQPFDLTVPGSRRLVIISWASAGVFSQLYYWNEFSNAWVDIGMPKCLRKYSISVSNFTGVGAIKFNYPGIAKLVYASYQYNPLAGENVYFGNLGTSITDAASAILVWNQAVFRYTVANGQQPYPFSFPSQDPFSSVFGNLTFSIPREYSARMGIEFSGLVGQAPYSFTQDPWY